MRSASAYILVTCDKCQKCEEQVNLTPLAGGAYDERGVDETLKHWGWSVGAWDICPECVEELTTEQPEEEE